MGDLDKRPIHLTKQTQHNLWRVLLDDAWRSGQSSELGVHLRIRRKPLFSTPALVAIPSAAVAIWIAVRVVAAVL